MIARDDGSSTRPKPSMLRALQNQSWTVHGALAELVDNSYGNGRGAATQVTILWNAKTHILEVLDNGVGMTLIRDLFRLGETVGRRPADIGEYGSGGTMALLYLASEVTIWTLTAEGQCARAGVRWTDYFAADDFPVVPTNWKRATAKNTPESLWHKGHGTLIQLKVLSRRKVTESNIRRELSAQYAPAVRNGCTLRWITIGQDAIDLADPIADLQERVDFDLTLEVPSAKDNIRHVHVTGVIGTIEDLPIERSRVAVSFYHRVIQWTRECYSHSSGRKYPGVGVCGWIHLDDSWQGLLSTTKDSIDDCEAWGVLMDAVFERIEPLLKKKDHETKTLLLDNIALELSQMFSAGKKTDPMLYGEASDDGLVEGPGIIRPGDGNGGGGDRGHRGPREQGDQDGGLASVVSKLEILFVSDSELNGDISGAEVDYGRADDNVTVRAFVNRDHYTIKVAAEQHPVNRMALALAVAKAIAGDVVNHPLVLQKWFGRKVAQLVEDRKLSRRDSLVFRLLMDRFKNMPIPASHEIH